MSLEPSATLEADLAFVASLSPDHVPEFGRAALQVLQHLLLSGGEGSLIVRQGCIGLQAGHQLAPPVAAATAFLAQPAPRQGGLEHLERCGVAVERHLLQQRLPVLIHRGGFKPLQHRFERHPRGSGARFGAHQAGVQPAPQPHLH